MTLTFDLKKKLPIIIKLLVTFSRNLAVMYFTLFYKSSKSGRILTLELESYFRTFSAFLVLAS